MTNPATVELTNKDLARQINDEARRNPQSPYAGKFVGIANGQLVALAENLDAVARRLRQCAPDLAKTFCIEVGADYDSVQEIWTRP